MSGDDIVKWLLGAVSALLGLLYVHTNRRLEKVEANKENDARFTKLEYRCESVETRMPSQFEREELARQRIATASDIKRIFETLDEMKDRATHRHVELLEKIDEKADK